MWIDIEDKECQEMLVKITDEEGNPTGKKIIIIQSFDLYFKEIGEGQVSNRITPLLMRLEYPRLSLQC